MNIEDFKAINKPLNGIGIVFEGMYIESNPLQIIVNNLDKQDQIKQRIYNKTGIPIFYMTLFKESTKKTFDPIQPNELMKQFDRKNILLRLTKPVDVPNIINIKVKDLLNKIPVFFLEVNDMTKVSDLKKMIITKNPTIRLTENSYLALYLWDKEKTIEMFDRQVLKNYAYLHIQTVHFFVKSFDKESLIETGNGTIKITLKRTNTEKHDIELPQSTTLAQLRDKTASYFPGCTKTNFKLLFSGEEVNANETLFTRGITDGAEFNVIMVV
ncbi:hypothetical protein EIN_135100 [Entamoeba invadens IP1]|uniref:Ubiquitin-like domain-containing protein n=1 Tax=Entamoeba invadens IP1 TaxID=370355 RepID=A0A0A1U0B1_ENTIV|nr:hypothetical protein EIN_135100 [Entamoeba invadens IP1]ELP85926.1 hypothetical protein EIN_135100 [Entamoeba invadens IP1]|eukprot:XP_004185272.1 hypothetical protein EIN_135100 [Entamoeba invadens IP1]